MLARIRSGSGGGITRFIKRFGPYVLSGLFLLVLLIYLSANSSEYQALLNLSRLRLLLLGLLILAAYVIGGLINLGLYRDLGAKVNIVEAVSLAAVNNLANQLPFAGGMVAKGAYLKRKFGLTYTRFLSATVALFVLMVSASGAVGLATLAYMRLVLARDVPLLLVAGFLVMLLGVAVLWLPASLAPRGRWTARFEQFLDGWRFVGRRPALLIMLLLLQLALMVVLAGRYWTAFHLMSQNVSLADCLLFAAATVLTQLVTITPDGLGIREGIVGGIATLLGFDIGVSVVAVTIDRLVSTAITIALGSLASYHLARRLGAHAPAEAERG